MTAADARANVWTVQPRVTASCLLVLTMIGAVTVAAGEPAPWMGTWQLDPAQSSRAQVSPYNRVTLTIAPAGDGLTVIYDMVGVRGGVTHLEWTGRLDGHDYPVQGADTALTNAYRRVDDRSYTIEVKVDSMPVAAARAAVSADGRTLTVTQQERDARGREMSTRTVYRRN